MKYSVILQVPSTKYHPQNEASDLLKSRLLSGLHCSFSERKVGKYKQNPNSFTTKKKLHMEIPIVGKHHLWVHLRLTLPETIVLAGSPLKIGLSPQKGHVIFQTSIFTGELLVSGRVKIFKRNATWSQTIGYDQGWMKQICIHTANKQNPPEN